MNQFPDRPSPTSVEAALEWTSPVARHRDSLVLPSSALQAHAVLAAAAPDLALGPVTLDPRPWLAPVDEPLARVPLAQFLLPLAPIPGRHYPRLAFASLTANRRDLRPCRVLGRGPDHLDVDPNHPLARHAPQLILTGTPHAAAPGRFAQLLEGPGMQAPPTGSPGDACYLPPGACSRQDETDDARFYQHPRLVHHLDAACRDRIAALHGQFLAPGMAVLDLMSSWVTHLPVDTPPGLFVTGLGMNREELAANPRLDDRWQQDLNRETRLPAADASFDLVICVASLEYLTQPRRVAAEVARVLRPGGRWVISFSDRWFPPKAIRVWSELHPYERLGLALWLLADAGFADLGTHTLRGLRRPPDDPHADERDNSDPLFAAWGSKPGAPEVVP